jgi:hypothetical protein
MIEVKPETAKKLQSLAAGKGVSVDELLRDYVPGLTTNGTIEAASWSVRQARRVSRMGKSILHDGSRSF